MVRVFLVPGHDRDPIHTTSDPLCDIMFKASRLFVPHSVNLISFKGKDP
uniref:Uncharacterized protein n=1 Tax=Lepeophtheirus salmonis TaxID=72036 RepID=A0A0K2T1E8_LEPSM